MTEYAHEQRHDALLIGLTGHARTGKDATAAYLVERYGFMQLAFADPLRSMVACLLEEASLDSQYVWDSRLKDAVVPGLGVSGRALMQTIGTECVRALDARLWIRHLELRCGLDGTPAAAPLHDRFVISDVRFHNEAGWIHSHRGKVWRLHRSSAQTVRAHASETQVRALPADVELHNEGLTLASLYGLIDAEMARLGIAPRDPDELRLDIDLSEPRS